MQGEIAALETAAFEDADHDVWAMIALSGEALLEAWATTGFIEMIEEGDGRISFAAEINLRSL